MSGVLVNGDAVETDPAAEFLAREQDELAGLGDDLPDVGRVKLEDQGGFDDFEMLAGNSSGMPVTDDMFGLDGDAGMPGFGETGGIGSDFMLSSGKSPVPMSNSMREEPEKIKKWREDQKIRLEEKDKEEEVQIVKLREQAKRELEEWYKTHEEQIEKTKAANRAAEKEYQALSAEVQPGQEWERIAKLCEFNPKQNRGGKDTSRMRSLILLLKQNPPKKEDSVAS